MKVTWEAKDGFETIAFLKNADCNVLVVDLSMPRLGGSELISKVVQIRPNLPLIVLSMYDEKPYVLESIRAGASGYITKTSSSAELLDGIRHASRGDFFLCSAVSMYVNDILKNSSVKPLHTKLTKREDQVFRLLIAGKRVNEIAQSLCLSQKTVSTHKTRVQEKLQAPSLPALVKYALKHGLALNDKT